MPSTTADRLKFFMSLRGLRQQDILRMMEPYYKGASLPHKITRPELARFVSGEATPERWQIEVISSALKVNPLWIAGKDVPMRLPPEESHRYLEVGIYEDILQFFTQYCRDPNTRALMKAARDATPEQIEGAIAMLNAFNKGEEGV